MALHSWHFEVFKNLLNEFSTSSKWFGQYLPPDLNLATFPLVLFIISDEESSFWSPSGVDFAIRRALLISISLSAANRIGRRKSKALWADFLAKSKQEFDLKTQNEHALECFNTTVLDLRRSRRLQVWILLNSLASPQRRAFDLDFALNGEFYEINFRK